jgi:hypothetical protein
MTVKKNYGLEETPNSSSEPTRGPISCLASMMIDLVSLWRDKFKSVQKLDEMEFYIKFNIIKKLNSQLKQFYPEIQQIQVH